MWYVYDEKRGDRLFPVFFETDKCVRVKEVDKKEEDDDEEAKKEVDDEKEKSVSTTVCCLCMKDNDFSSHIFVSIIFCIHLNWHRACLCVCVC